MIRSSRRAFAPLLLFSCVLATACADKENRKTRSDAGEPDGSTERGEDAGDIGYDAGSSGGDSRPWDYADPCAAIDCPPDFMCVDRHCVPIGRGNGGTGVAGFGGFGGR